MFVSQLGTSESSQARFRLPSPLLPSQSSSAGRNINNGGGCDGAHFKIGKEEEEEEEEKKKKKKKKGRSVLLLHEDSGFASVRTRRVVGVDDSPHLFDYSSERHQ